MITSPIGPSLVEWETGVHTFKIDPAFFFTNQPLNINNVSIDFNDGVGLRNLTLNSTVQVNYTTPGEKIIKININLVGGMVLKGTAILGILPGRLTPTACNGFDIINVTGLGFNATSYGGLSNEQSTGTGYIYYSNGNCLSKKITKPIIFLDGFDPKKKRKKDERTHQKIWDEYINKRVLVNGVEIRLGDRLRAEGYDIIIYDYEDGGDLIEKNALAVVQFLQTFYNQYQSTLQDDFVVIGPSYGSLVAQYALTYCEKNNIAHHTRLYISFDGPQQGANVPIGMQQIADYFTQKGLIAWLKPDLKDGLHHTKAARQMLVHHSNANTEIPSPDNFRNIYKSNLIAIGEYPTKCRKIAIINGSSDALANTFLLQCQEIIHFDMNKLLSSNKKLNWNAYASAKTNRCESLNMLTDGWLIRLALGGPSRTKILYTQPPVANNSYDVAPGGYFEDTFSEYDGKVKLYASIVFGWMRRKVYRHNLNGTFMPSVSAADIRLPSLNLNFPFKNLNLACEGITPFDRVYAPTINEPHVSITPNNVDWFEKEIKGIPPPIPNGSVYTVSISGPVDIPCTVPVTLTATANSGLNTQYTWSFSSPNVTIVSGQGTASVQVQSISTTSVNFNATVSVSTACGTGNITKALHAGAPNESASWIDVVPAADPTKLCKTRSYVVEATFSKGYPQYEWLLPTGWSATESTQNPFLTTDFIMHLKTPNTISNGQIRVRAKNDCNYGPPAYISVGTATSCSGAGFLVYPNPADQNFTLKFIEEEQALVNETIKTKETLTHSKELKLYQIILYDNNMMKVHKTTSKGESVSINTIGLINGIYYLQVNDGKKIETTQIAIQH